MKGENGAGEKEAVGIPLSKVLNAACSVKWANAMPSGPSHQLPLSDFSSFLFYEKEPVV